MSDGPFDPATERDTPPSAALGAKTIRTGLVAGVAILVAFLGGWFISGALHGDQDHKARPGTAEFAPGERRGPGGGPFGGRDQRPGHRGNMVGGTVKSVSGSTVTLTTRDGETVKVTTTKDTKVVLSEQGTAADLAAGDKVFVLGDKDGDTITAKVIGERPERESGQEPGRAGAAAAE